MATQFTATVKPSGGDYTSLNDAGTGLANDITAADIKVFSISAYSTPTIAAGDTVLGQSSLATGVCVLVNTSRTQILIKTIAVSSFQNGEVVQKTTDANVRVTLSNTGDSPIIGIECYSMSDTTPVRLNGYTLSSTNYIYIYTPISERHQGKWDDTKYNLTISAYTIVFEVSTEYVMIEGLQIYNTLDGDVGHLLESSITSGKISISKCIIKGAAGDCGASGCAAISASGNGTYYIYDNIIYNINQNVGDYSRGVGIRGASTTVCAYNNTIYNCRTGIYPISGSVIAKNNLCYNNTDNYVAGFNIISTNNLSGPQLTDAPGLNPRNGPNMFVTFVDELNNDFHLASNDIGARNYGTNLNPDPDGHLSFPDDIDGQTRPGQLVWDIGADEYFPMISHGYIIG